MAPTLIYKDNLCDDEDLACLIKDISLAGSPMKSPTSKRSKPPKEVLTGDSDDDNWPDTDMQWTHTSTIYSSKESDITSDSEYDDPAFNKCIATATKAGM